MNHTGSSILIYTSNYSCHHHDHAASAILKCILYQKCQKLNLKLFLYKAKTEVLNSSIVHDTANIKYGQHNLVGMFL